VIKNDRDKIPSDADDIQDYNSGDGGHSGDNIISK
jgi:hypothetical protein